MPTLRIANVWVWILGLTLLIGACSPAAPGTSPQSTQLPSGAPADITLDYSAVAQNVTIETVAAQPASADGPWWEVADHYRRLTLQGYPIANHQSEPQIFIYPAGDLASANENAGKIAADLQALLQTQQAGDQLPFLPLSSARQALDVQVQYLDFKSGKGVRFLTQFNTGMSLINNHGLIYSFQGLTSDGKYYIAAVLPVTNPELPADSGVSEQQTKALNDFPDYISKMVTLLNQQPADSFTPDLNKLDALVESLRIGQ
jgi:hypothetical protein